jgi:pyridoxal phosphate enzyme (YggS family)
MDTQIAENIARIKRRIAIAAARCGRDPHSIKLMAVTKTVSPERILKAAEAGITLFGENYIQEAKEKIAIFYDQTAINNSTSSAAVQKCLDARRAKKESRGVYENTSSDEVCSASSIRRIHSADACPAHAGSVRVPFRVFQHLQWHMIGHLQTNKAKYAVHLFDYIHSVDRWELAKELDKRAGIANHHLNILIEVNVSGEQTKNGIPADEAVSLIKEVAPSPNLTIRGLMTMAPYSDNPENSRPYFAALRKLKNEIAAQSIPRVQMEELSMGMTDDFEVAIEEGSTIVRIGRAIFGER